MDIKCSIFSKFPPNILVVKMNYELATPSAAFIYYGVRNPHRGRTSVVGKLLLSTLQGTLHRCLRKSSYRESGFLSHWLNCLLAWSRARGAVFPAAALFLTRTDTSGGPFITFSNHRTKRNHLISYALIAEAEVSLTVGRLLWTASFQPGSTTEMTK